MSVALCMIIKNEAPIIRRCLDSVLPLIDTWSICDTGSTDGTQDVVRQHLRDMPGTLHERPWVDQQHNRNESMELARDKADWLLLIDADETIATDPGFAMPQLAGDCYDFTARYASYDLEFPRCMMVRTRYTWRWRGKRHPGLYGEGARNPSLMPGIFTVVYTDGASWNDPEKYRQHVRDMLDEVAANPGDTRALYYLAQSYRDAGMLEDALSTYLRVADTTDWTQRRWSALYEAARLRERMGQSMSDVVGGYLAAVGAMESRAEPLYHASRYLRRLGFPEAAYPFAKEAAAIARPTDRMFVEPSVYRWRALNEWLVTSCVVGELLDAKHALARLLESAPQSERARLERCARALG